MSAPDLANQLRAQFGDLLSEPAEFRSEYTLVLRDPEKIETVCAWAKQALLFDYLVDISSIDNYEEDPRFTVVYHLYGHGHRCHLRLKTSVSEDKCELPTVTAVWRGANWHEREIFDMMGIRFRGHPDLRRILMWEGYPYYPLRKDFPVSGKPTEVPEVAFTDEAPMEGGPFITIPGPSARAREPRARIPEATPLPTTASERSGSGASTENAGGAK